MKPIEIAVKECGGQQSMADALGVSQPTVSEWVKGDRPVPAGRCIQIEQLPNVTQRCEQLNPDVGWVRVPMKGWPHGKPLIDKAAKRRPTERSTASSITQSDIDPYVCGATARPGAKSRGDRPDNHREGR